MTYFLLTLLLFSGFFLTIVILLQRGRGGGLVGALGGQGGQSAFGTRAGDTFTWITIVTVLVWVVLAALTGASMKSDSKEDTSYGSDEEEKVQVDPAADDKEDSGKSGKSKDGGLPDFEDFNVGPKGTGPLGGGIKGSKPAGEKEDDEPSLAAPPDEDDKPADDAKPAEPAADSDGSDKAATEKSESSEPDADSTDAPTEKPADKAGE